MSKIINHQSVISNHQSEIRNQQSVIRPDLPVMIALEEKILAVLEQHIGRENAITARDIGTIVGTSARQVRKYTRRICCIFGYPVLARPSGPAGYYLAGSAEELTEYVDRMMDHAKIEIAHAMKLQPERHPILIGQLMIDIHSEASK